VHKFLWPPPIDNSEIADSLEPLNPDTAAGILKNGDTGWLYVRVEVLYNGHHTDFCEEFRVIGGTSKDSPGGETKPSLVGEALCQDTTTNTAD
jgi:hypothetical protein